MSRKNSSEALPRVVLGYIRQAATSDVDDENRPQRQRKTIETMCRKND
jgi:hypothetical protein